MESKVTQVLRRVERENEEKKVWIVGPEVGQFLYDLVIERGPQNCLEIGTSVGYSAIWIGSALRQNGSGKLCTVESHAERFERAQKNIAEADLTDQIMQIKGHAPEVFTENLDMPQNLDLAFFDATKYEHQSYFDAIFPRLNPCGILIVDNVISHAQEMAEFRAMLESYPQLKCELHEIGAGVLVCEKG
jgi:predicted O-methyltransferase YrrM